MVVVATAGEVAGGEGAGDRSDIDLLLLQNVMKVKMHPCRRAWSIPVVVFIFAIHSE